MRVFSQRIHTIFVISLFFVNIIFAQTGGQNFDLAEYSDFSDPVIPSSFISLYEGEDSYIILVEKRGQKLFLLNNVNGNISIIKSYLCSTGRKIGDKKESGDLRTPEGVYFFRSKIDSTELPPLYGAGAFVLDYPNIFDRIKHKNGYGIWLHGTNEPERIQNSNDTKGCIVVKNEDILELGKYIVLNETPIIVVNEIVYRKLEYVNKDKDEVLTFLKKWKKSWESKNIKEYIQCYSRYFKFRKMNLKAFRSYKKRVFNIYKWIKININNIQIFKSESNILISFLQEFKTDSYYDYGVKQLYLTKEDNSYKIIGELWSKVEDNTGNIK
ncbi:hypothetical protein DRQ09_10435 [candidate division KSB1 bacterium]|nr:MAG: hypothetical protein DRQ09_10435 [candidate division KSB1 bacterium]